MTKSMSLQAIRAQRSARHSAWTGVRNLASSSVPADGCAPSFDLEPAAASLSSFGGIVIDLLGVDGVAEDGDQQ
jgi:hypothetical protein